MKIERERERDEETQRYEERRDYVEVYILKPSDILDGKHFQYRRLRLVTNITHVGKSGMHV